MVALLDASKAFDRVQYVKLFNLLIKRGLCPIIVRFLALMYTNQFLRVDWNECISDKFVSTNGVKQGAILSPILFCIYFDELIIRLKKSGYGCYIGDMCYGTLAYADDICLLSPSRKAMSALLDICEQFSKDYDVLFNSAKSQLVLYDYGDMFKNVKPLFFNGIQLNIQYNAVHLGHSIGKDCNNTMVNTAVKDLVWRTNNLFSRFSFCSSNFRSDLFRTYCNSYYDCPLWCLNSKGIQRFYISWRQCVRKVWKVPRRTHCTILKHLYGSEDVQVTLLRRFLGFYNNIVKSNNSYVRMCAELSKTSQSNVALNRRYCLAKLNVYEQDITTKYKQLLNIHAECDKQCFNIGNTTRELCLMRDGILRNDFTTDEINALINDLCTS